LLTYWKKRKFHDINEFNISINNYNGIFQIVALNLVVPFAAIFAKRLDASDFQVALLSSLPAIVSVGAIIPGAIFMQKCGNKKNATGKFFMIARTFYICFALVPFAAKEYRASLFILLYGLMNLPGSIALVSWQSFIARLFPPHMRAQALALRNSISTFVGTGTTLLAGWLLYAIPRDNAQRIELYQVFFVAAFIFATLEIYLFYKHKELHEEECAASELCLSINPMLRFKNALAELKSNKAFVSFSICAFVFHISWYMALPLFSLYEIDYLHSNEVWTSLIAATSAISSAVAYPYWSKLVYKRGNILPLSISIFGMAATPLLYSISHSLFMLLPICILAGLTSSGMLLIMLNTVYEVSPAKNRTMYIAYFNTMTNIVLATAPFIGIALKNALNIYAALVIAGIARILSSLIFYIKYKKEKVHVSLRNVTDYRERES